MASLKTPGQLGPRPVALGLLIPLLADRFHVVAPDFPGFGMSDMPLSSAFDYTFEQIAIVIERLAEVLGLDSFALYVFDYGAPVGFRVAARYPERVTAIVLQRYESLNRTEGDDMSPISRGFRRRHVVPAGAADRVPPGQYVTDGFPVLSAGPTPHTPLTEWTFSIRRGGGTLKSWTWQEFQELPAEAVTVDIHCVTRWSKLDTEWRGVSVSTLLDQVEHDAGYVMAFSDGGYTTDLPLADVTGGRAWVAYSYGGGPLEPEHGGPARLLVPHLYFWKSAKWIRGLELMDEDQPGFWENYGYHMYGDPWKEQRYQGD